MAWRWCSSGADMSFDAKCKACSSLGRLPTTLARLVGNSPGDPLIPRFMLPPDSDGDPFSIPFE